jgi:predicted dehydrogenase
MDRVVWGMIGCGNVTEIKSGPAFYKSENSELLAVMCRNANRAQSFAQRHNILFYHTDAEHILQDSAINTVYIATPVKYHAPYAIRAMKAGKNVYVEKPMALNYNECLEMKRVHEESGTKLFVAYYRRSLEYFIKIKSLLDKHLIGDIKKLTVELHKPTNKADFDKSNPPWRVIPGLSGGGYFYDLACHQFDIMQFLLGPIAEAQGIAENKAGLYAAEDTVHAKWTFLSGLKATGNWSFVSKENDKKDLIIIEGSKGSIEFSAFDFTPVVLKQENKISRFDLKPPQHIQMPFIQSIISELTGRGESCADLESAIQTSKIMEDIIYPLKNQKT